MGTRFVSMLTYILQRFLDNGKATLGILTNDAKSKPFSSFTLEDEYRKDKVKSETRIPAGTYIVDIQPTDTPMTLKYRAKYSWFKKHLEIKNVDKFVGIYIHIGNTEADTAGCVLLGKTADISGTIANSTDSFKSFYELVYPHLPITLIVRDEHK